MSKSVSRNIPVRPTLNFIELMPSAGEETGILLISVCSKFHRGREPKTGLLRRRSRGPPATAGLADLLSPAHETRCRLPAPDPGRGGDCPARRRGTPRLRDRPRIEAPRESNGRYCRGSRPVPLSARCVPPPLWARPGPETPSQSKSCSLRNPRNCGSRRTVRRRHTETHAPVPPVSWGALSPLLLRPRRSPGVKARDTSITVLCSSAQLPSHDGPTRYFKRDLSWELIGQARKIVCDSLRLRVCAVKSTTYSPLRARQEIRCTFCCWPPGPLARRERRAYPLRYVRSEQRSQGACGPQPGGARRSRNLKIEAITLLRRLEGGSLLPLL